MDNLHFCVASGLGYSDAVGIIDYFDCICLFGLG